MRLYFTDLMCFQKNPANIPCKQAFNLDRLPTLSLKMTLQPTFLTEDAPCPIPLFAQNAYSFIHFRTF